MAATRSAAFRRAYGATTCGFRLLAGPARSARRRPANSVPGQRFECFLDVLLVIFIPRSAVNIVDYFLVRRGHYDVASFFIPNGIYGKFSWRGLIAYALGLAVEFPFVSQPDYTGPLVKYLGGADISWLVGWFVAAIVYLVLARGARQRPP